ncbi:hypothetical protein NL676_024822 [Syzygium grande]|nr:hypothetical protein NL676_024822 [Syzygium grande]
MGVILGLTGRGTLGKANLEDYGPIDPAPYSKGSIRPGRIDHRTPLIPFIPKPSPPIVQPRFASELYQPKKEL